MVGHRTITEEHILDTISTEQFMKIGKKTMICCLILKNGFEVIGSGSCVDPDNFNENIGKRISRDKAIEKVWELEGYILQDKLNNNEC